MKIDLDSDAKAVRNYVEKRIKNYLLHENLGPGESDQPVSLVTVGFYASQGGYANLVFDTRPKAEVDGEWTIYIDNDINTLPFPKWAGAFEAIWEGERVAVTKYGGSSCDLEKPGDDDLLNRLIGEMLMEVMTSMRAEGALAKLPLAPDAFMVIEEFDGEYFWPLDDTKEAGRIQQ